MEESCKKHQAEITHICLHAHCLRFHPLCNQCLPEHNKLKHQDFLLKKDQCGLQTTQILERLKDELERTQDRAAIELTTVFPSNIDETILEIESIRHQINKLFDRYIQALKDKFEQKIKIKIHRIYDEIKLNLETIKSFQNSAYSINTMRTIHQNDLEFGNIQQNFLQSQLENLISLRVNQKFEGKIDDDVALHFIGVIQKELEKLVIYEKLEYKKNQMMQSQAIRKLTPGNVKNTTKKFVTYATLQQDQILSSQFELPKEYQPFKSSVHYFEPNTKNLHILDVVKQKSSVFTTIPLQIDFTFSQSGRSIVGDDGKIYYFSGYDENNCIPEKEEDYKNIYVYVPEDASLRPLARMITMRNNFALCSTHDQDIYIIGGQNHKEGCLRKCEKLSLKHNSVTIINQLPEPSSMHTLANYNNQYLFKFGGLSINIQQEKDYSYCKELIYVYNIEQDKWTSIDFPRETQLPQKTLLSSAIQMGDNIYVFGGLIYNNNQKELTTQAYQLKIDEEEEFDQADCLSQSLGFSFILNYHPLKIASYQLCSPFFYEKSLYAWHSPDVTGYNKVLQVFQNKWKDQ